MRSIIEEIASAEQQAQETAKNAAAQSRERLVQAREQAERAAEALAPYATSVVKTVDTALRAV